MRRGSSPHDFGALPAPRALPRRRGKVASLAIVLALGAPAFADTKPDEKKEKGPDAQGSGKDMPGGREKEKNPLPEIVDRMKSVERRIAETDTGKWTKDEQDRIVEALDLEGQVVLGLEKLIEEIESQPPSGGGGGGEQERQRRQKGQPKPQPQSKERRADEDRKPVDPQGQKGGQQKKERDRDRSENDKRREGEEPENAGYKLDSRKEPDAAQKWGDLPPKARAEMIDARQRQAPQEWRRQIEDYFRKLAEPRKP